MFPVLEIPPELLLMPPVTDNPPVEIEVAPAMVCPTEKLLFLIFVGNVG